jgi:hypothetical protein
MAEYEYTGPNPVTGEDNEIVHPGDVRDFGDEPDCPPWRPLGEPEDAPPPPPAVTPETTPAEGTEGGM